MLEKTPFSDLSGFGARNMRLISEDDPLLTIYSRLQGCDLLLSCGDGQPPFSTIAGPFLAMGGEHDPNTRRHRALHRGFRIRFGRKRERGKIS
jgi:hypothetical protein